MKIDSLSIRQNSTASASNNSAQLNAILHSTSAGFWHLSQAAFNHLTPKIKHSTSKLWIELQDFSARTINHVAAELNTLCEEGYKSNASNCLKELAALDSNKVTRSNNRQRSLLICNLRKFVQEESGARSVAASNYSQPDDFFKACYSTLKVGEKISLFQVLQSKACIVVIFETTRFRWCKILLDDLNKELDNRPSADIQTQIWNCNAICAAQNAEQSMAIEFSNNERGRYTNRDQNKKPAQELIFQREPTPTAKFAATAITDFLYRGDNSFPQYLFDYFTEKDIVKITELTDDWQNVLLNTKLPEINSNADINNGEPLIKNENYFNRLAQLSSYAHKIENLREIEAETEKEVSEFHTFFNELNIRSKSFSKVLENHLQDLELTIKKFSKKVINLRFRPYRIDSDNLDEISVCRVIPINSSDNRAEVIKWRTQNDGIYGRIHTYYDLMCSTRSILNATQFSFLFFCTEIYHTLSILKKTDRRKANTILKALPEKYKDGLKEIARIKHIPQQDQPSGAVQNIRHMLTTLYSFTLGALIARTQTIFTYLWSSLIFKR